MNCQETVKQGFTRFLKNMLFVLPLRIGHAMLGMKMLSKMSLVVDLLIVIQLETISWWLDVQWRTYKPPKNEQIDDFKYVLCYMYKGLWKNSFAFYIQVNWKHMHLDFDYVVIPFMFHVNIYKLHVNRIKKKCKFVFWQTLNITKMLSCDR